MGFQSNQKFRISEIVMFNQRSKTPLSSADAQLFGPSIGTASMARSAMRDRVRSTSLRQIVSIGCWCCPRPELPQQRSHSTQELQTVNSNFSKRIKINPPYELLQKTFKLTHLIERDCYSNSLIITSSKCK